MEPRHFEIAAPVAVLRHASFQYAVQQVLVREGLGPWGLSSLWPQD